MATKQDIQFHYDNGNELYQLFLDKQYMQYSCALWDGTNSLEDAQIKKLQRISKFAKLKDMNKVLDIGCGWGGAMKYLIEKENVKNAYGITISQEQYQFIRDGSSENISVRFKEWQSLDETNYFDSIISVCAFEHFATPADKINNKHIEIYKHFFQTCHKISKKNSFIGLQTIVSNNIPKTKEDIKSIKYLLSDVFPGSSLPSIRDIKIAIEGLYVIEEQKFESANYVKTLNEWHHRFELKKDYIIKLYGLETYNHYIKYFKFSQHGFKKKFAELTQLSLKKI
jgi:cyclopropane-fatty-acyl-phospholipid synthase